ncbi:MAG: thiamine pyrophosphate-binding protein [Lautropia sp.]
MPDPHRPQPAPGAPITGGALVAAFLEACGVRAAFGVISIHNMPILDAIASRAAIRFVPARGEAGAGNMADACARSTASLGVCITSTGPAAGNIAGSLVEALTAGTPLLHLTGQIETTYLDRGMAYIHEAPEQLAMLGAVSKKAYRVRHADTLLATLREAVRCAMTAPSGPVSVEIPIDIQAATLPMPADLRPLPVSVAVPDPQAIDALADRLAQTRRPLLWIGGGARGARDAIARLRALGFGIVSSTQGRGIVAEDDPATLGAYNIHGPIEAFYRRCDAMLVAGSRLRGNETLKYTLKLPSPLLRIDADPAAEGRCYPSEHFVAGDAALALAALAERLEARGWRADPQLLVDLRAAGDAAREALLAGLGPYAALVERLQRHAGRDFFWVRDVTLSNSTWGNRELRVFSPHAGVHATGGGIGQGLAMAIGAAVGAAVGPASQASQASHEASPNPRDARLGTKTLCLVGDGGLMLNVGELATAVQEGLDLLIVLMNDRGYGVIRNIQDAQYGGRRCYADLHTPDFEQLCASLGVAHARIETIEAIDAPLARAAAQRKPFVIEVDMTAIGGFSERFAGPPVREHAQQPSPPIGERGRG